MTFNKLTYVLSFITRLLFSYQGQRRGFEGVPTCGEDYVHMTFMIPSLEIICCYYVIMLAVLYCQMLEELALLDEDVDSHVCRCLPEHCTQSDVSPQGMKPDSGSWCYDIFTFKYFVCFFLILY